MQSSTSTEKRIISGRIRNKPNAKLCQVKERGVEVKGVTFHRFAFQLELLIDVKQTFAIVSVVEFAFEQKV